MKKDKFPRSSFEQLSDLEKIQYRQNVFDLSEKIISDENEVKRLTAFSLKKIQQFSGHHSINGREAEDFIQDAILKIVEGDRYWNGHTEKDLLNHIYYIIPSLIWNELKKIRKTEIKKDDFGEYKSSKNIFVPFNPAEDDEEKISEFIIKGTDTSILDTLINQEIINQTEIHIYKELEKNQDYIGPYLYEAHLNGISEPHKHVADSLNVPIEDVRNAEKRLKRIINKSKRFYNEG